MLRNIKIPLLFILITVSQTFSCSKPLPVKEGKLLTVSATSTAKDSKDAYNVKYLSDDSIKSWCEGKPDDGIGESIEFTFEKEVRIQSFFIKNGFGDPKYFAQNNRIHKLKIESDKGSFEEVELEDTNSEKEIVLKKPLDATKINFTIISIRSGSKFKDTCITELGFNHSSITDIGSMKLCGVDFKLFELEYTTPENNFDISYNSELAGGSGSYLNRDLACSHPEKFIFDSVQIESKEEGNVFSIEAKFETIPSSVDSSCAPRNVSMNLEKCIDGIKEMKLDGSLCNGVKEGSKVKVFCK
ncbi:MAG TPA: hypothetical protein PK079_05030 [Leptospiraceae bacterium]|nr:hypothetical protein [Leptospiraceae bacterium]HMW06234.1 hypothetical protein [Leptospiraceae bacterium]HMX34436.1 hypothetical protein [Leptospiraceae bacterium]HMY31696.1 hypothetical protein [Leptospiraceae bacterium]HMZ65761.1 hypothetical protein [Leptospiraceae bacterium]